MPSVGGGTSFSADHEPSLLEGTTAAAAAANNATSPSNGAAIKRLSRRYSTFHSNHDVKWPSEDESSVRDALERWTKKVREGYEFVLLFLKKEESFAVFFVVASISTTSPCSSSHFALAPCAQTRFARIRRDGRCRRNFLKSHVGREMLPESI